MTRIPTMGLGNFSVSLAVKDLAASRAFYEKLGFEMRGGNARNFVILQNGATTIGLFHDMFERNMLTFNPTRGRRWSRGSSPRPGILRSPGSAVVVPG